MPTISRSAQQEFSDLNAAMEPELGSALSKEVRFVGEKYRDWGCPGTERMSSSDAISRAYDVHRAISKLSSISPEIVDQLTDSSTGCTGIRRLHAST
jgi:hypothetical protein